MRILSAVRSTVVGIILVAVTILGADTAFAAPFPLEITAPRQNLVVRHRMLKAYPGIPYNIRAAVVGGMYPFTYSLNNAPSGMTINSATGEITWTNPTANATPTLVVRDSEGTQVSQTWTIAVSTAGFRFVDAVNGSSSGAGTLSSPWRTLADVRSRGSAGDTVYFRSGTYTTAGIPTVNSGLELRVEFDEDSEPVSWIAYPGAAPIIDQGYSGSPAARIRLTGEAIYVEGFEVRNIYVMGFQVSHRNGRGSMFRKMNMHGLMVGGDGSNAALIMTTGGTGVQNAHGMVVQDSSFSNVANEATTLKFYYTENLLVEDTVHSDAYVALEVKESNEGFTVRKNYFFNIGNNAIGGNMADNEGGHAHFGEICFNHVRDAGSLGAMRINQHGEAGRTYIYRNTFRGRVQVQNTDSADGPFYLNNNVIVNSDSGTPAGSHVYHSEVSSPSRIILSNNLVGYPADNIVDSNGNLTAAFAQYVGTMGHVTGGGTTLPVPAAPTGVRIIR